MPGRGGFGLALFSAGWVLPIWAAALNALELAKDLFRYFASGGQGWPSAQTGTSFPIEDMGFNLSAILFSIGCVWLLAAIVYWVRRATRPAI